jgi:hypothetical protein
MLSLPNVTLVMVETRAHELARATALDAISKVEFGDVAIMSDNFTRFSVPGARNIPIKDVDNKNHAFWKFCMFESFKPVTTRYALFMEWDAGVVDPAMWMSEFLDYDYIGAPWWWKDGHNVGNGGFSIRTKAFADFIANDHRAYTDNMLCRDFRDEFERKGWTYATEDVARAFSFEGPHPPNGHNYFGFHGVYNWTAMLDPDDMAARVHWMKKLAVSAPGPHYHVEKFS